MRQSFALVLLLALTALASAAATQAPPLPSPQSPIKEPTVLGPPKLQVPIAATPEVTSGLTADQETILAGVYFPTSVAFDSAGNLYITEGYSSRVRKVTPAGTITFVAGTGTPGFGGDGGPATSAQLQNPFDIAVDTDDNLFIADAGNSRIRKISANGVISTVAGTDTPGFSGDDGPAVRAQLKNPRGIALDAKGNLYISDTGNSRIRKVTPTGMISTIAGSGKGLPANPGDNGPAIEATLRSPYGIAVDATGNLSFADPGASRVRKIAPNGTITTVAGNGTRGFSGDGGLATAAQLNSPLGVALDAAGNLYISDAVASRVRQVTPDGKISTLVGTAAHGSSGDGGPAAIALLDSPFRAVIGPSEKLYIVDPSAQRIRVVSQGQIDAVPGTGKIANPLKPVNLLPNTIIAIDPNLLARVGGPVSAPSCKATEPNYSNEARMAAYSGTVVLDAAVWNDGSVRVMGVSHPIGFGLDQQAMAVLDRWKCTPSMRDGVPVNVQLKIQINFHLY
jgi:TonB family protein